MQHIFQACSPEAHRPIMAVNGTADDVTYFNGDLENQDGWGMYLDMPTIVDLWRGLGQLGQAEENLPDLAPNDGSRVVLKRYFSDEHPREFLLYQVENGGHDWPGVWGNMDLDTTGEIWKFFTKVIDDTVAHHSTFHRSAYFSSIRYRIPLCSVAHAMRIGHQRKCSTGAGTWKSSH